MNRRDRLGAALLGLTLAAVGCSEKQPDSSQPREAWNRANDPTLVGAASVRYDRLPTSSRLDAADTPWTDYYWPTYQGGLAYRWQTDSYGTSYRKYLYRPLSSESLNRTDLSRLSPAEKFDLYQGRTHFPLVEREQTNTRNSVNQDGEVPTWFGNCHGWAAASLAEPEPVQSVQAQTPAGRSVTFYPSDVKALVTGIYSRLTFPSNSLGVRCNERTVERDENARAVRTECRDLNPATLHLALAHYIDQKNKGLVVDFNGAYQVWNFPVVGYNYDYRNFRALEAEGGRYRHSASGTRYLVDVALNIENVRWTQPGKGHTQTPTTTRTLAYTLELDSQKRIIGGEWQTENHPDFLWDVTGKPRPASDRLLSYEDVKPLVDRSAGVTEERDRDREEEHEEEREGDGEEDREEEREEEDREGDSQAVAQAVLKLVNTKFADYLINVVGVEPDTAYAIRVHYIGPDGRSDTRDDQPFRSLQELSRFADADQIAIMKRFVKENGWVRN